MLSACGCSRACKDCFVARVCRGKVAPWEHQDANGARPLTSRVPRRGGAAAGACAARACAARAWSAKARGKLWPSAVDHNGNVLAASGISALCAEISCHAVRPAAWATRGGLQSLVARFTVHQGGEHPVQGPSRHSFPRGDRAACSAWRCCWPWRPSRGWPRQGRGREGGPPPSVTHVKRPQATFWPPHQLWRRAESSRGRRDA